MSDTDEQGRVAVVTGARFVLSRPRHLAKQAPSIHEILLRPAGQL